LSVVLMLSPHPRLSLGAARGWRVSVDQVEMASVGELGVPL
jgi:hypothetical protein